MSIEYPHLYSLTKLGLDQLSGFMGGEVSPEMFDSSRVEIMTPLPSSGPFTVDKFDTAKAMAKAICESFGGQNPQEYAANIGLWGWFTVVLADQVFPAKNGVRKLKEYYRWFPAPPSDWQKAQRHLIRMPTLLYSAFGRDADHLLCGPPHVGPDIREQLTSQQDMFSLNFQKVCRKLYYNEATASVKRGSGSKEAPGVPRRLAAVRQQLDVTWDMTDLTPERIMDLLPPEFDAFKGGN